MSNTTHRSTALSDTQLVLLSAAAQHPNHILVRPERVTAGVFTRAARQLLRRELVEEIAAATNQATGAEEDPVPAGRFRITPVGLKAIGIEPEPATSAQEAGRHPRPKRPRRERSAPLPDRTQTQAAGPRAALQQRSGTKRALIVALLSREQGASLSELMATTGWLAHTTRAALTGLRQAGHGIERSKGADGTSIYRIVSPGSSTASERAA